MKKINKVVAGMMVLGMGASIYSAIPMQNFKTVDAAIQDSFTISGFNTSLEIGESVTLPEVSGVTRVVLDPKGKELTITDNKLVADIIGTYTVRYIKDIENSDGKSVQEYKVNVTGDRPSLKFASNSDRIIPQITNYSKDIVLPVPTVVDAEGEEIENAEVSVEITSPSHEVTNVTNEQLTAENGYALEVNKEGIYTITYKYYNAHNVLAYKTYSVTVQEDYDASNISLTHSLDSTMPSSLNLGAKVKLPSVTVKDANNSNAEVSAYYSIKVVNVKTNREYAVDSENIFIPMDEGEYRVTYTIKDFFGSKLKGSTDNTFTYTIAKCSDTVAPEAMAVANYNKVASEGSSVVKVRVDEIENKDANTEIFSKFYVTENGTNTMSFPAIFALDDFEVQKVTENDVEYYQYDTSKITFTRTLKNSNGAIIKSWVSTSNDVNENEAVTYKFEKGANYTGTYRIEYSAKDSAGNSKTTTYTFDVVEGLDSTDSSAPTISFDDVNIAYAKAGQKISFKKPTIVDYLNNDAEEKEVGDTRVRTSTYYYFNEDIDNKIEIEEDKDNSENLSFTLPKDLTGYNTVTIVTYANDDYNPETSKSYTITLIGGGNDTVAPEVVSGDVVLSGDTYEDNGLEATIDQLNTVRISDVVLYDLDEYFGAKLNVRFFKNAEDKIGTSVSLDSLTTVHDAENKTITLKNGSFKANNKGTYVISVISQDLTGNTVVKYTTIKTNDVVAPEINVNWNYTSVELGEKITLPQVQVIDDGETIDVKPVIEVDGPEYELNGYEFTPLAKGDYKVKFIAKDSSNNTVESEVYTLHAEDTVAPTIELDSNFPETAALVSVDSTYQAVRIPDFVATDSNGINYEQTKVTIKNKSGNAVNVNRTADNLAWEFVPTGNGAYTVTYTAVDNAGLKTEKEYTVKVGDVTAPVITINNEKVNKPGSKKVGDKLELDLDSIIIKDAIDTKLSGENGNGITMKQALADEDISAYVYVYDPNNNLVSKTTEDDAEYYNLTEQGTYRIVYRVTDASGNTTSDSMYSHSFTVNAKTTSAGISTQTLGIILIVASLLLLGGVVVYFFATRKVVRRPKAKKED